MPSSQGSREKVTCDSTKDAACEINGGFTANFSTNNNAVEHKKSENSEEMALKATLVTLVVDEAGGTEKPGRLNGIWFRTVYVIFSILAFSLLIAFVAVLFLYVKELDKSETCGLSKKICVKNSCIRRAAGIVEICVFIEQSFSRPFI